MQRLETMSWKQGRHALFAGSLIIILLLGGCFPKKPVAVPEKPQAAPPPKPNTHLVKLLQEQYPDFKDDLFFDGLDHALAKSLEYFRIIPERQAFLFGNDRVDRKRMIDSITTIQDFMNQAEPAKDFNAFIRERYDVYKSIGNEAGDVLFTGYYEPCLRGSLEKSDDYSYPVYATPEDLVSIDLRKYSDDEAFKRTLIGRVTVQNSVVPYYERKEIGRGDVLSGKAKVIAYVSDKVELFFLEVQGSGIIYLDNGDILKVHYQNKNGKPYRSIGNYLINSGKMNPKNMSMQKIKEYLKTHPSEVDEVLNFNPSYVFFKEGKGGPYGCYGVEVSPERSIATDKQYFPACALAYIETSKPLVDGDGNITEWAQALRFVLNQDTGGAIKGPGRVDLFKGSGAYAELAAGHMKHNGSLYFLVLKESSLPVAPAEPVSPDASKATAPIAP